MKLLLTVKFAILLTLPFQFASAGTQDGHDGKQGDVYAFANQCYGIQLHENMAHLIKQNGQYFFSMDEEKTQAKFTMRPAALGVYLLYDQDAEYLSAIDRQLAALDSLVSEMTLDMPETDYLITAAEWEMYESDKAGLFHLYNLKSKAWLAKDGLVDNKAAAALLSFSQTSECAQFPESQTGASGHIIKTEHDDGSLWGFVDAHEHSGGNHGFGGKVFHGASFHKLGIEHALADCEKHHGKDGSRDFFSVTYKSGSGNIPAGKMLVNLYQHFVHDAPDHATDGYPTLNNWNVHQAPTHQSLYYKWLERAYLGGMRLMVEYIESAEVVCHIVKKIETPSPGSENCNEMAQVDHQLGKIFELQDYIDAQSGGPGKGWFRIVFSPGQAREVIKAGKLAVIIGMEIENPFNCFVDGREGFQPCTSTMVREQLREYYDKGIRALFPSHKFVNAFSSGDGNPGILELGDYLNTGQWRDYVACEDVPGEYWMHSHGEGHTRSLFSKLADIPGLPLLNRILSGDAAGTAQQKLPIYPKADAHCQRNGFTPLGMDLLDEMMKLGMIIDLGHTPKAALNDVLPVLHENNYPAVHTHGGDLEAIRLIKGFSSRGLGSACRDEKGNSKLVESLREIAGELNEENGLPLKGLSYDFNGFAGYNKPRFGDLARCEFEQKDPLEYPFQSFAGDITFEKLQTGNKVFDFNNYGLANIGLLPDLIEEARRAGASQEEITALFKTAESYIQLWEKADAKAQQNR